MKIGSTHEELRRADIFSRPVPLIKHASTELKLGNGRWVMARDLKVGDTLLSKDGIEISVDSIEKSVERVKVFNISVEGLHNYSITKLGILVHNK